MLTFFKTLFGLHPPKPEEPFHEPVPEIFTEPAAEIVDIVSPVAAEPLPKKEEPSRYDLRNYQYPTTDLFPETEQFVFSFLRASPPSFQLPVLWSCQNNDFVLKNLEDLHTLLIAGSQATGKTTFIHQILLSLLLKKHPSQIKFVLIDSKGLDLRAYRLIEKHFLAKLPGTEEAVVQDTKQVVSTLHALCIEMDIRYALFVSAAVRNVQEYNAKFISRQLDPVKGHQYLPALILIVDDLGNYLFEGASEITRPLLKLITDGYKTGIYTIVSTSQTTGQALPNMILEMITHRVAFRLNSREAYRRFFDTTRLDIPLQSGSFLYNDAGSVQTGRTTCFSRSSINQVAEYIGDQPGYPNTFLLPEYLTQDELTRQAFSDPLHRDPLFEEAARLIVKKQIGSTSIIQRMMKLGYNRASRLMDQLEAAGIVGPNLGGKPRDVLIRDAIQLEEFLSRLT